eukprot:TRINITY_DN7061_c0_g1_i2.p1 TRINITY_DN7061_c0_g1~~TRINITY_DN7061_c0_g1_i2.p1  ORF type:complete len:387 (-),score=75.68 TRINITY_DN7061_c0_g1_i2:133-1293(-)
MATSAVSLLTVVLLFLVQQCFATVGVPLEYELVERIDQAQVPTQINTDKVGYVIHFDSANSSVRRFTGSTHLWFSIWTTTPIQLANDSKALQVEITTVGYSVGSDSYQITFVPQSSVVHDSNASAYQTCFFVTGILGGVWDESVLVAIVTIELMKMIPQDDGMLLSAELYHWNRNLYPPRGFDFPSSYKKAQQSFEINDTHVVLWFNATRMDSDEFDWLYGWGYFASEQSLFNVTGNITLDLDLYVEDNLTYPQSMTISDFSLERNELEFFCLFDYPTYPISVSKVTIPVQWEAHLNASTMGLRQALFQGGYVSQTALPLPPTIPVFPGGVTGGQSAPPKSRSLYWMIPAVVVIGAVSRIAFSRRRRAAQEAQAPAPNESTSLISA